MTEAGAPPKLRAFVALQLPQTVRARVAAQQDKLKRMFTDPGLRWTKPEQFHLTLRFLGYVPGENIAALAEAVQTACSGFRPFEVTLRGAGAFPSLRRPRVLWVGLDKPTGTLASLQRAVCANTQSLTSEPAEDRFSAHVTLARIKDISRQCSTELGRHLESLSHAEFGRWTVTELDLMRSQLGSAGAVYTRLSAHALQPN